MTETIFETKKTIDDFVELLNKIPERLRDNVYFTINGMLLSYAYEEMTKEQDKQVNHS